MKIVYVCDHGMDLVGGSQVSLKVVMDAVKDKNSVVLITPGSGEYCDLKIRHYHYSKYNSIKKMIFHPISFFRYIIFLAKKIRLEDPEIIHTQEQAGFFIVSFLKRVKVIKRNVILIHTERGLYKKYSKFISSLFFFSFKFTNAMVVTTQFNFNDWKKSVESKRKKYDLKMYLIENTAGSLFEDFNEDAINSSSDKLVVGFSARYCDWKGWDTAEQICCSLKDVNNICFKMIVGCLDEKSLKETNKMFERLKGVLGERFYGDVNYNLEQMNDFYYGIDIFIITSKPDSESFGRVLVEAMSRKTVVLGTDCGGAVEVIGSNDYICNDIDGFRKKIMSYEADKKRLNEDKEKFFERFKDTYSLRNNIIKHEKMYNSLYELFEKV